MIVVIVITVILAAYQHTRNEDDGDDAMIFMKMLRFTVNVMMIISEKYNIVPAMIRIDLYWEYGDTKHNITSQGAPAYLVQG